MRLTREKIQRMAANYIGTGGNGGAVTSGGGGGGGGTSSYAAEAGHAQTADEATHATSADNATTATTATNLDANSTDWQKIMRKDIAQTAADVITFAKGIVSTLVSKFKAGIKIGASDQYEINANGDATLRDISGRVFSASGNISSGGTMQAVQMLSNTFKSLGYNDAWLDLVGKGFGVTTDANGISSLQVDNLLVLGQMIVNSLNIREVTFIGGAYYLSPAASEVAMVQLLYTNSSQSDTRYWTTEGSGTVVGYRLLWKADNGTIGTMNYWHQGDMVYCHTFNVTEPGQYTNFQNQNYKRLVCRVGTVTIDDQDYHYADVAHVSDCYLYDSNGNQLLNIDGGSLFVGVPSSGNTTPKSGDKVVACGSQYDTTRQGVILISTEGEASIGIYDGIKDYRDLSNYEIHYFSKTVVRMSSNKFYWRSGSVTKTQDQVMNEITTDIAQVNVKADEIRMTVGKTIISAIQSITANYDNAYVGYSWETGYFSDDGSAQQATFRIRSAVTVDGFTSNGYLCFNSGSTIDIYSVNSNTNIKTYALRYTSPSDFTVKAHVMSFIYDNDNDSWVRDQHIEEAEANSGVCYITPNNGIIRFKVFFVSTDLQIGNDVQSAVTALQPMFSTVEMHNSMIQQTADQLQLKVEQCGIDINNREINLVAGRVNFKMPGGSANPKISIDSTTGTIYAKDGQFETCTIDSCTITGSLMYHKILRSTTVATGVNINLFDILNSEVRLLCDTFILYGSYGSDQHVQLPPAKFFPGVKVKIVNGTYRSISGQLESDKSIIILCVYHSNDTEARAEDVNLVAINNLAVTVPFINANGGMCYYDYYEELRYKDYTEVELVSQLNWYHNANNPEYYVWMVVSAHN